MAYRHDGGGMGAGPLDPKVIGWMWGFLWGAAAGLAGAAILYLKFG